MIFKLDKFGLGNVCLVTLSKFIHNIKLLTTDISVHETQEVTADP